MSTETEDNMRTALRQADAITAVGGQRSTRHMLGLAHKLYDALVVLDSSDRARRIRLIDDIFRSPVRDSMRRHGQR